MRDLGAYPNSLFAWRSAVKDKYGGEYNSWRYSQDQKVDCVEKGGQWTCTRTAKPCLDLLNRAIGGAKEAAKEVVKKKDCKAEPLNSYGAKRKARKEARSNRSSVGKSTRARSTARNTRCGRTPARRTSIVMTSAAASSASPSHGLPALAQTAKTSGKRKAATELLGRRFYIS